MTLQIEFEWEHTVDPWWKRRLVGISGISGHESQNLRSWCRLETAGGKSTRKWMDADGGRAVCQAGALVVDLGGARSFGVFATRRGAMTKRTSAIEKKIKATDAVMRKLTAEAMGQMNQSMAMGKGMKQLRPLKAWRDDGSRTEWG